MAEKVDYAALKKGGFMRQKQKGCFSLRLAVVGGNLTAENIKTVAEVAEKYGHGYVHMTSRQGIEIPFIKVEDINEVKEELAKGGVGTHLESFLKREFGESIGKTLCPVMNEHYRLAYIRKPEFMGNTRVEEYRNSEYYQTVKDLPWSSAYLKQRVEDYNELSDKVQMIDSQIPDNRKDAFFPNW